MLLCVREPERGTMRSVADDFVFSDQWWDLRGTDAADEQRRRDLERELRVELTDGHPLFGTDAIAVAACSHCDDVIFRLDDQRFAVVHLVWQGQQVPPWPDSGVLGGWEAVASYVAWHEIG